MSDPNDASGYSKTDLISQGFIHTPELKALVDNTRKVADLDVTAFDALIVAGGQAPMFTFEGAADLHAKFAAFFEAGKVAAALCHGSAILAYAKDSKGEYIAKGPDEAARAQMAELLDVLFPSPEKLVAYSRPATSSLGSPGLARPPAQIDCVGLYRAGFPLEGVTTSTRTRRRSSALRKIN